MVNAWDQDWMSAISFFFREGRITRRSPIRENKGGSTEELSSRSKPNSINSPVTMLDTVLAVTGGKPDPTTKAGRGAVAEGPEPGNAINPDGWDWENEYGREGNTLFVPEGAIAVDCHGFEAGQNNCELEG